RRAQGAGDRRRARCRGGVVIRDGALAGVLLALVARAALATTQVHAVMGTFLRVDVADDVPLATFDDCFAEARALDRAFSRFDPASELVRVNAAGGGPASERFRRTLARAMALAGETEGTFDVSVGALTALWRAPMRPGRADVAAARRTVGRVSVEV